MNVRRYAVAHLTASSHSRVLGQLVRCSVYDTCFASVLTRLWLHS